MIGHLCNIPQLVKVRQYQHEIEGQTNNVRINWDLFTRVLEAKREQLNEQLNQE